MGHKSHSTENEKSSGAINTKAPTIQFIIAHYNEDLEWLVPLAEEAIIYTKGSPKSTMIFPTRTVPLPNIGREGHTYLYHIVTTYNSLPDVCVFLQGRIDDHVSLSPCEIRSRASQTRPGEVTTFPWRELELFDNWSGIPWHEYPCWKKWTSMSSKKAPKTPAQYFIDLLSFETVPESVGFQPGALFAVHRDTIRQHPLSLYERLLKEFFLGDTADVNPETGHYMERFWLALWAPKEYVCWSNKDVAKEERNRWGQLARGRWHRTPRGLETDPYLEESLLSSSDSERQSERSGSEFSTGVTP
jgi:hypothetical protein